MIKKVFDRACKRAQEKNWDCIYVAVDWHDTMCKSTYGSAASLEFYDKCLTALYKMSKNPHIRLILYTSSYNAAVMELFKELDDMGIYFYYCNTNPEISNTEYGDFSEKFYYDVLLDDKAGFDPLIDWQEIIEYDFSKYWNVLIGE